MEFNEQNAINYIRSKMPEGYLIGVDDDEMLNVIDIIWDYYDDHGMLDIEMDSEDDDLDVDDLVKYVKKMLAKDKHSPVKADEVDAIVRAELEYEESIDIL